jgi:hypothetical protein
LENHLTVGDEIKHTPTADPKNSTCMYFIKQDENLLTERFVQGCSILPIDNCRKEWILENCVALTNGASFGSEGE